MVQTYGVAVVRSDSSIASVELEFNKTFLEGFHIRVNKRLDVTTKLGELHGLEIRINFLV